MSAPYSLPIIDVTALNGGTIDDMRTVAREIGAVWLLLHNRARRPRGNGGAHVRREHPVFRNATRAKAEDQDQSRHSRLCSARRLHWPSIWRPITLNGISASRRHPRTFIVIASRLNHDNWLLRKEKGTDHVLWCPLLAESRPFQT